MRARCVRFLAPVLTVLALCAPALGQPQAPPFQPGKGAQQEFLDKFEREDKKILADGNYDVIQRNNERGEFIYRCKSRQIKSEYAIELSEQALARARARNAYGDMDSRYVIGTLVQLYQAAGKHDRAIAVLEEFHQWHRDEYGEKNRLTLDLASYLGRALLEAERYDRAAELYESLVANCKGVRPEKIGLLGELMRVYEKTGNLERELATGELLLEQLRAQKEKDVFGRSSLVRVQLARRCTRLGKKELAQKMMEGDLQEARQNKGDDHLETIALLPEVANRYFAIDQPDRALALLTEAVELRRKKQGADHADTLLARNSLAQGYLRAGKLDEAIETYAAVLPKMKEKFGASDQQTQAARSNLANAYESRSRPADAEPLWRETLEMQRKVAGAYGSYQVGGTLALLGRNLLQQEKWAEAEKVLGECLAIRRKQEPQSWSTFNTASLVGASLLRQKKYKEAEPLLLEGYQGMKQRERYMPPPDRARVTEALQRLVKLYDETDRKDRADEYRKPLPAKQPSSRPR
jgi:tetratricopeptide (TPR) repeat protein